MTVRRTRRALAGGLAAAAVLAAGTLASPATAAPQSAPAVRTASTTQAAPAAKALGIRSLAYVLAADGKGFDRNSADFDILDAMVRKVLARKPDSPVALLTKGRNALTLFAPTDAAFERLVQTLGGPTSATEQDAVRSLLKAVDVDTLEQVLLYHVVPGATLDSSAVLAAAKKGTDVTTAQGGTWRVSLSAGSIVLFDKDPQVPNPRAITSALDINEGNRQIAHAIHRVALPIDLES